MKDDGGELEGTQEVRECVKRGECSLSFTRFHSLSSLFQPDGGTYEAHITAKPELAEIDWKKTQRELHNWIRGNDKVW